MKCRMCDNDLPEYLEFEKNVQTKPYFVHFENGVKHSVIASCHDEAIDIALVSNSHIAELCVNHMVQIVDVTEFDSQWRVNYFSKSPTSQVLLVPQSKNQ